MAKLEAHGEQAARLLKEDHTGDEVVSHRKTELALMTDGKILRKQSCRFRGSDRRHDWGWKLFKKFKPTTKASAWLAKCEREGWTVIERREFLIAQLDANAKPIQTSVVMAAVAA